MQTRVRTKYIVANEQKSVMILLNMFQMRMR